MPVMNGLELTKNIRENHTKNELNIIALSSNEKDDITAAFLKNGANDYIQKPFSKEEFSCRINNSIDALENIQTIVDHSNRDYLTGLYNRRYITKHLEGYMQNSQETGEIFAVTMISIDDINTINSTFGFKNTDKVIVNTSEILRSNLSSNDTVARVSGDEFCVILKNINQNIATGVFKRLKEKVINSRVHTDDDQIIKYTISIGACMNEHDTFNEILDQADMLLHKAKQAGGNQVLFE
jgi:diguanylate cyclase (GGDEF)-like protein